MKNFRKFLAVFLSIAMVMCSALPSLASETETTLGASEEIVESSTEETSRGEACEPEEETESTEEIVGASTASPEDETESDVGESTVSLEEETESEVGASEDSVGASSTSPEDETESDVGESTASPEDETNDNVGASTASPEEESESTDETTLEETTLEETTLEETTTDETTESPSELKATKSEIVNEEKLLGDSSGPWMYWWLTDGNKTIHYKSSDPGGVGAKPITGTGAISYEGLEDIVRNYITKAVFEDEIEAETCEELFRNFYMLQTIEKIKNLKTSKVTNMNSMFKGCTELTVLDVTYFDTSEVIHMNHMFSNCFSLTELDLKSFKVNNVEGMDSMFYGCSELTKLNITSFTQNKVKDFYGFLGFCSKLDDIDLSGLDTSSAENMQNMFRDCSKLEILDLSSFNTENVTNMAEMFADCLSLKKIIVSSKLDTSKVTISTDMFSNCTNLVGGAGTRYDSGHIGKEYARIDRPDFGEPGYFTSNWMYWWLTDGDKTIHYQSYDPGGVDANPISGTGAISYDGLEHSVKRNIVKAVFEDEIDAETCENLFYEFHKLKKIEKIDNLKTSKVTNMTSMFAECHELNDLDVTKFNTENVTNMAEMFADCLSLKKIIVSSKLDTSKVTISTDMFSNCTNLVGGAGTRYDSGHIDKEYARIDKPGTPGYFTDVNWMYWWLTDENKTIHYQSYNPDGVDAKPITGTGAISYDGLDDSVRTEITKVVFEDEIEAETCEKLFYEFYELNTIASIENLKTSKVTNMNSMFYGCEKLTSLDVTNFDTSEVTNMSYMFRGCSGIEGLNLENFKTSKVTNMYRMFLDCSSLLDLDLSKFITDNVEDMSEMFAGCSSLTELDLKSFKVNNVENMSSMFSRCSELTKLDITNFTSNKVKNFQGFLEFCSKLEDIDLGGLDTSSAVNMEKMFYKCGKLQVLDLSSFNTTSVKDMMRMFYECLSLEKIIVSNKFSVDNVTIGVQDYGYNMFFGCTNLVGGAGTTYDGGHTDKEYARIDEGSSNPGYFSNSPWMHWYLSDSNKTIHYTYAKPASGDYNTVTRTDQVVYDNLTKSDITKAVLEEDINPVTCEGFFESFTNLKYIEGLEKLRTVDVKNMKRMFFECSELEKLDLKHFNTSNVELMEQMFSGCNKLVTITVADHLVTTSVTDDGIDMFENCTSLVGGNGTKFDASHTNKAYARADKNNTPGYFTGTIFESISINTPPQNTVYTVGDTLDPSGLKINLHYSDNSKEVEEYNSQTEADFTFRPSLGTALALTDRIVTVTYDGKSTTFTIEVKQSGGGGGVTPKPGGNPGGSSSGSSGGSGGGPTIPEDVPGITYLNATSAILGVFASSSSNWSYDPVDNSWQLNSIDANGNAVRAINGLYALTHMRTHIVNGVPMETIVTSVYCLNAKAKMVTGWVKTLDGKWFFFENKKNADEGKMVTGWKQIQGAWYYFGEDGAMYIDTVTPDGYRVGADGKLIQ